KKHTMKKILLLCVAAFIAILSIHAQEAGAPYEAAYEAATVGAAYEVAAAGALAIEEEQAAVAPTPKPKYWDNSLSANISFGQNGFVNWAAGGYDNYSLKSYVDANANYSKGTVAWTNRLQLDYGFLYSSDKPVIQKADDRIYLESKFAYNLKGKFNATAEFNFKSQFSNTFSYPTPTQKADGTDLADGEDYKARDWRANRELKSGFASPAYTNLALGIEYVPTKWLTINLAPITGGIVSVDNPLLRKNYSMPVKHEEVLDLDGNVITPTKYKSAEFEFGAQLKVDIAVNVNDNFKYTSQVVLFSNYLDKPQNMRVNWDNRIEWTLVKYLSLIVTTSLIYDDDVWIDSGKKDADGNALMHRKVQFTEGLSFGFIYSIATKK
ncbi:MAG: DUF3078 domain-containing protein, partial [Bacteroidales bacterium]|nr:DUF3078 domain-containing protein [Bacteroidales bacterium]